MKSVPPASPHRKWQIGIGIIFVILFMFSASLLGIGVRLRNDAGSTRTMTGYARQNCTLDAVQVVGCPLGGFTAVWRRKETGFSVVSDPFSLLPIRDLAQLHTNDFPLTNMSYPCVCNPSYADPYPAINCKFEDVCMLNVPMVEYMQKVGMPFGYAGDTLIAIGSLVLFCFLFGFMFLFLGNGLCDWCCCCPKKHQEENVFYVIGDPKE